MCGLAFLSHGAPRVILSTPPSTKLNIYFLYLRPILRLSILVLSLIVPIVVPSKFVSVYGLHFYVGSLYFSIKLGLIKSLLDPLSMMILTGIPLILA